MGTERGFENYLSRHMAHLGDPERYRERRKRQLIATYERWLPADRDAELLEIGPGYGQWLEVLRTDRGFANAIAVDIRREERACTTPRSASAIPIRSPSATSRSANDA